MGSRRRSSRPRAAPEFDFGLLNGEVENLGLLSSREFYQRDMQELLAAAEALELPDPSSMDKRDLIGKLMSISDERQASSLEVGVLEIVDDGYGFIRGDEHWLPSRTDIYVSQTQVRRFGLRTGDQLTGQVRRPKDNEKYRGLVRVVAVNNGEPEAAAKRPRFQRLTPIFPEDQLTLENDTAELTSRVIDMVAPIGRGQRGLIVSPPKAGKTELMKRVARAIISNHDDVHTVVALIGERPEEVTDWERAIDAEVISSTFDETPASHCRVAEMTMARARRLVESGENVVLFLDSITRLARAYNLAIPSSGKTMSGGMDPAGLIPPKTFFGSGRNIEGGGSLTVLASCLIDTGSRMDEVIYEEFKGTGNWELILNRRLAERGTFPAVDVLKSGTRRIELLLDEDETRLSWLLRRMLSAVGDDDAVELMMDQLRKTKTNKEFLELITKQSF